MAEQHRRVPIDVDEFKRLFYETIPGEFAPIDEVTIKEFYDGDFEHIRLRDEHGHVDFLSSEAARVVDEGMDVSPGEDWEPEEARYREGYHDKEPEAWVVYKLQYVPGSTG